MSKHGDTNILAGLVSGAAGGLAGSFAMELFELGLSKVSAAEHHWLNRRNDSTHHPPTPERKKQEHENAQDEPSTVKAAESFAELFGEHLTPKERPVAGEIVHYTFGATSGALYGLACEIFPIGGWRAGIGLATGIWATADEMIVPAMGWSKPPTQYSFTTHLSALLTHFVYGITTEAVRRAVRQAL